MKLDDVATVVGLSMKAAITPVSAQVATLEARVIELEHRDASQRQEIDALKAKAYLNYCGVWKQDQAYAPGDTVTRQGGQWTCAVATHGEWDHAAWQLSVKSPRR